MVRRGRLHPRLLLHLPHPRRTRCLRFTSPSRTPVERGGQTLSLHSVSLLWETLDAARIGWLVLQHGGMERLPLTERLAQPPSSAAPFDPPELWRQYYPLAERRLTEITLPEPLPLRFGIQLCVMVSAPEQDGTVRFFGAGTTFTD